MLPLKAATAPPGASRRLLLCAFWLLASAGQCDDAQPAKDLLMRLVGPTTAKRFDLSIGSACGAAAGASECATLSTNASTGNVRIVGSNVNSLTFGIGHYVKDYCNTSLTWTKTGGMGRAKHACASQVSS